MSDPVLDCRTAARFIADGVLRFDALVPDELNRQVLAELSDERLDGVRFNDADQPFDAFFAAAPAYRAVIGLPRVQAVIRGLVGANPRVDHVAHHRVPAGSNHGQSWHADATIDPRTTAFDIQVFYFPHDTPREAGGTLFLPGSQFRRVHEFQTARYQDIVGQQPTVCPAGTVLIAHHNLWHCARPNRTAQARSMIKLRLNPRVRQRGLFDLADLHCPEVREHLGRPQPWHGVEARIEILQRLRLYRALTGSDYDQDLWLTRLEAPGLAAAAAR